MTRINDRKRGLYEKYRVTRNDGESSHDGKHDGCEYFVLDLTHDEFAIPALEAYAKACATEFPKLAADLRAQLYALRQAASQPSNPET